MSKYWRMLSWALLVGTFALAGYTVLDQSVTIAYHDDAIVGLTRQRDFVVLVANAGLMGKSKGEVERFLRARQLEYSEKDGALITDETSLLFKKGKLASLEAN